MAFNFTIGCDPEIFLKKNNKGHSCFGLIPGDKQNPFKTDGGAVQVDGMAAEFNTDPVPIHNFDEFNANIIKQLKFLRNEIPKEYSLSIVPVMDFDKKHMDEQPEAAKELGCDPDYNAYTLKPNPRPEGASVYFRSGAGHIHYGWGADIPTDNEDHLKICANFVKCLDATVGLFMTFIDREPRRRELYGKAGAFRPKSYGVEYRTPSNVWIINRDTRKLIHALSKKTIDLASNGREACDIIGVREDEIQEIINTGNHALAKIYLDNFLSYGFYSSVRQAWDSIKHSMRVQHGDS